MFDLPVPAAAARTHDGRRKAAVFLMTLGPEASSGIFEHLRDDEVEELTAQIAALKSIDPQERDDVLAEFGERMACHRWAALDGPRAAGELPAWSLQPSHAIYRPHRGTPADLLRRVRGTAPERLHALIRHAPAETIALILAHLEPQDASIVHGNLSATTQADVAERIAAMDRTAPELVREAGRLIDAAEPVA